MFVLQDSSRPGVRSSLGALGSALLLGPGEALAQNATADAAASCNASFHRNCIGTSTSIDFTGSAAPLHDVGDHPIEFLLILAVMTLLSLRLRADRKRKSLLDSA